MRRRPGIQGLQRGVQARVRLECSPQVFTGALSVASDTAGRSQEKFEVLGDSVQQSKLEVLKAQTALFRDKLEEFALSHRCARLLPCYHLHSVRG